MICIRAVVLFAVAATALGGGKDVIEMNPKSFKAMLASDEPWMVEFYAPWCGHCKNLAPEWSKAATALKGIVKMGAVDMTQHESLGAPYNVRGFPTIKIFGANKKSPSDYNGARTAKALADAGVKMVRDIVSGRMGGGGRGGGGGGGGNRGGKKGGGGGVVELTESNFKKQVLDSEDLWLVEFFAPWCGHCKNLEPHWRRAANELKGEVKLGAVDATVHQSLAGRYGVQGYPTIKVFPAGSKSGQAEDYQGGRETDSIVAYARELYAQNMPAPEVEQLLGANNFESACTGKQICFLAFLPHILDASAAGRNADIKALQDLAETFKQRPFGWVWAEGGQQTALESGFDIGGFGYPAMAALNSKKKKFAVLRGAFTKTSIKDFVNHLVAGRTPTSTLSGGIPDVVTVTKWDGKDGNPAEAYEEEFDLSELDDIDLDEGEEGHAEL